MNEQILDTILTEVRGLSTRFGVLESRFDTLESRFDTLESRFDTLESRFGTLESEFGTMNSRIKTLENRVDSIAIELKEFREETRTQFQILKKGHVGIRNEISDRFREVKEEQISQRTSIDLLVREQFKMKTDIELLKKSIV